MTFSESFAAIAHSLQEGPTPTKAALQLRSSLKRKALFADNWAISPLAKCGRSPGAEAVAVSSTSSSQRSGSSHHDTCEEAASKEGCGVAEAPVQELHVPARRSTASEALEAPAPRDSEDEEGGLLRAYYSCAGEAVREGPTLPPLALAAELPEEIRGQLTPTPLEEMLERDRRLAAAVVSTGLPEGVLLLACDLRSPYVRRLRGAPLLQAPSPPALARNYSSRGARRRAGGAATGQGQEAPLDSPFDYITIPELELPRADQSEEQLRRDILALIWEPEMLWPRAWADVDRWHNMHAEFYAARQRVTWSRARQGEQVLALPANFVSTLLA